MEWVDKMNAALDYIEDNLTENIDFEEVARRACCSSYNFQRMFSFITDTSLAEYIRRRRMSAAALDLQKSDAKVIEVAMKYGYESPISFSRAFSKVHGITPKEAKKSGAALKIYPKISFQISIKGEIPMITELRPNRHLMFSVLKQWHHYQEIRNILALHSCGRNHIETVIMKNYLRRQGICLIFFRRIYVKFTVWKTIGKHLETHILICCVPSFRKIPKPRDIRFVIFRHRPMQYSLRKGLNGMKFSAFLKIFRKDFILNGCRLPNMKELTDLILKFTEATESTAILSCGILLNLLNNY